MAASAGRAEGSGAAAVEDFRMQSALVFPDAEPEDGSADAGRRMQVLLDDDGDGPGRRVRVLSRGEGEEGWTLHAEGRVSTGSAAPPQAAPPPDIEALKAALAPVDLAAYYRAKAAVGIDLGPSFRTLESLRARPGEALAEVALPAGFERDPFDVHPLLLDGCFQAVGAARSPDPGGEGVTYLPFAWERLWLGDRLPERLVCHVRMREGPQGAAAEDGGEPPEVRAADLRLYDPAGALVGELAGFTVKRATQAALLAAVEGIDPLLYEVVWRDRALAPGVLPADFLAAPSEVAAATSLFTGYLADQGVEAGDRAALLADLESLSRAYALATLDRLGWERAAGEAVDSEELRQRLKVGDEHRRLFRRLLEMQVAAGVLEEANGGFAVAAGSGDPLPDGMPTTPKPSRPEWRRITPTARTKSGSFGAAPTRSRTCCAARRTRSRCSSAAASRPRPISISRRRWRARRTGCWRMRSARSWRDCRPGAGSA